MEITICVEVDSNKKESEIIEKIEGVAGVEGIYNASDIDILKNMGVDIQNESVKQASLIVIADTSTFKGVDNICHEIIKIPGVVVTRRVFTKGLAALPET